MENNVIRMPYAIKPRAWIEKLIQLGYLRSDRRHDAQAVEAALQAWRERSRALLGGDEP